MKRRPGFQQKYTGPGLWPDLPTPAQEDAAEREAAREHAAAVIAAIVARHAAEAQESVEEAGVPSEPVVRLPYADN